MVIRRLQEVVAREPGWFGGLVGLALSVAAPTALRFALQPFLGNVLWFPTYYPAVLAATLLLGWRIGLASLLLSALAAEYFFIPPQRGAFLEGRIAGVVVYLACAGIIWASGAALRVALLRLNAAAERQAALNHELIHRVNNSLTVVQAIAAQTMRLEASPEFFYPKFTERLSALACANNMLKLGEWNTCSFPELPEAALRPFRSSGIIRLQGPVCSVPANSCVPVVLALHELATNAAKYGALSTPDGIVTLTWGLIRHSQCDALEILWIEAGGPRVQPPTRRGFGSRLLARQPGLEDLRLDYRSDGVRCRIVVAGAASDKVKSGAVIVPAVRPPFAA